MRMLKNKRNSTWHLSGGEGEECGADGKSEHWLLRSKSSMEVVEWHPAPILNTT